MEPKRINKKNGLDMYIHTCTVCGKQNVPSWGRKERGFKCGACREEVKDTTLSELKAERTLELAKKSIGKKKLAEYEKYLGIIEKNLYRPGWFQSSTEIVVALELLRNGLQVRHQVKMGKWRADFVIPEMKIVLEVDGTLYHQGEKAKQDKVRDAAFIAHLGPEWEVVRVNEETVKKNIKKLLPAVKKVVEERKRVRKNFDQKLPKWYSEKHV